MLPLHAATSPETECFGIWVMIERDTGSVVGQPGVEVVVAGCDRDKVPSIRTLEELGFRRTGEANAEIRWRLRPPLGEAE